jgi:hypothetical protein
MRWCGKQVWLAEHIAQQASAASESMITGTGERGARLGLPRSRRAAKGAPHKPPPARAPG